MKTAKEVYELREYIMRCETDGAVNDVEVAHLAMRDYAREVIDHILTKYMPEDQRYASSGEQWCRVEVEPIQELKDKLK